VAVDAEGRPTRDPAMARLGALLLFGGYKGFGRAFIVQALRVLAGSALDPDKDDGYLFVVLKPDLLIDPDAFKQQLSALIDRIKATPRQPGIRESVFRASARFAAENRLCVTGSRSIWSSTCNSNPCTLTRGGPRVH
jgi:LDH2 family malate/lactate/ureidoglycolate dehydrogenase